MRSSCYVADCDPFAWPKDAQEKCHKIDILRSEMTPEPCLDCEVGSPFRRPKWSPFPRPAWRIFRCVLATAMALAFAFSVWADTGYYHHNFFDNSITSDAYYYSSGKASAPSTLALQNGKLPVETRTFFTPPNALRLEWLSAPNGGWDAEIDVVKFRNREINFYGDTLAFWIFSSQ